MCLLSSLINISRLWDTRGTMQGQALLVPGELQRMFQSKSVPSSRNMAANSLAVCRRIGRPFSSEEYLSGMLNDTQGCGCSDYHGYVFMGGKRIRRHYRPH